MPDAEALCALGMSAGAGFDMWRAPCGLGEIVFTSARLLISRAMIKVSFSLL